MMEKNHPFKIKLQSENIDFVEVSIDLIPQYLDLSNNQNISKCHEIEPIRYCYEDKLNWVNRKLSSHAETFSMIERKTGKFIGNVEFYWNGSLNCRNFGISLLEEYQNQHYGTEAIEAMIRYGFQQLHLEEIHLVVFSNNKRAIHCYKKLGFVEYKVWQNVGIQNNEKIDDIYMKLVNPEITLKDKSSNQCKPNRDLGIKYRNTCYDVNKGEYVMKFTENFSEETQSKSKFLEQIDAHEEKERLINELIEQMKPYLAREEDRHRKDGMSDEEIQRVIKKTEQEILSTYTKSLEELQKMVGILQLYNSTYSNQEKSDEKRSR